MPALFSSSSSASGFAGTYGPVHRHVTFQAHEIDVMTRNASAQELSS
jgi:hypothetical protein